MKRNTVRQLLALTAFFAAAGTAVASNDAWSGFQTIFRLKKLENVHGYYIDPDGATIQPTNPDCSETLYYAPQPGHPVEHYEEMNKILLTAFLSGRKVRFEVNGVGETCSSDGYAMYENVELQADQ